MIKLALTGKARSGKDTVAAMVKREVEGTRTYALASPIKDVIYALVGASNEVGDSQKDLHLHYQITAEQADKAAEVHSELLNRVDKDVLPEFWEFWNMLLSKSLIVYEQDPDTQSGMYHYTGQLRLLLQLFGTEFGRSQNDNVWLLLAPTGAIITDVRFDNEAQWFRELGYTVVAVERDTSEYKVQKHISEAGVNSSLVDVVLKNTGTLVDLEYLVNNLIKTKL